MGLRDSSLIILTHSALKPKGPKIAWTFKKRVTNQNDGVFFFIAHEKGFKLAYSFLIKCLSLTETVTANITLSSYVCVHSKYHSSKYCDKAQG